MPSSYRRFSNNPFSRVTDHYGNDVTHERMAHREGTIRGARVYPSYQDWTVLLKQTVRGRTPWRWLRANSGTRGVLGMVFASWITKHAETEERNA